MDVGTMHEDMPGMSKGITEFKRVKVIRSISSVCMDGR